MGRNDILAISGLFLSRWRVQDYLSKTEKHSFLGLIPYRKTITYTQEDIFSLFAEGRHPETIRVMISCYLEYYRQPIAIDEKRLENACANVSLECLSILAENAESGRRRQVHPANVRVVQAAIDGYNNKISNGLGRKRSLLDD